jgi:hypothetical protein
MAGNFLKEDNGKMSFIRVAGLLALLNGLGLSWAILWVDNPPDQVLFIIVLCFLAAFAPKAIQKIIEQKIPGSLNTPEP